MHSSGIGWSFKELILLAVFHLSSFLLSLNSKQMENISIQLNKGIFFFRKTKLFYLIFAMYFQLYFLLDKFMFISSFCVIWSLTNFYLLIYLLIQSITNTVKEI